MKRFAIRALVAMFLLVALLWSGFAWQTRLHHIALLPPALEAGAPIYVNEVARGFGPGANEAGILVYALPDAVAARVAAEGVAWLNTLDGDAEDRGLYRGWRETPVADFKGWESVLCEGQASCASIVMFAQKYTFLDTPPDPELVEVGDRAVTSPGSFYAYGSYGVLLIVPDAAQAFYAYRG